MNFLKTLPKLSKQLSFSFTRSITTSRDQYTDPNTSIGIGGEIRYTSSDCCAGHAPYHVNMVGTTLNTSERGALGGTSSGETIVTRNTLLDSAVGVGGSSVGMPYDPPTGLSEAVGFGHHSGSGVSDGGFAVTNEGLAEGPGTSKLFK